MQKVLFITCGLFCIANVYGFSFDTLWGECTLENNGNSIPDTELIKTIKLQIQEMDYNYGPILKDKFFIIITNNDDYLPNYQPWKWCLGITFTNPDKIVLKDPALSKISKKRFYKVINHELNHLMLNRFQYYNTIPRWYKEGIAMKIANEISLDHKIQIAKNINNKNLFNIYQYSKFKKISKKEFNFAYAISAIYILSLEQLYGKDINKSILNNLNSGQPFDKAFYNATKVSLAELNDIIYVYIKRKFFWFRLIDFPKNILSLMPLLLVIGFFIKSYKNKKIKEKWEIEEQLEELEKTHKD